MHAVVDHWETSGGVPLGKNGRPMRQGVLPKR
jgi:hypothetical protein